MSVQVRPVANRAEKREFLLLPGTIHREHKSWAPPLDADERRLLNPKRNLALRYCKAVPALAFQDGRAVGRVMGIVNRRYNELRGESVARFSHFESVEDQEVAHALLQYVEDWAREQGMKKVVGPMGFTDQDPEGFLIEGFEEEPALASYQNLPYVIRLLEAEGYSKELDYVVYRVPVPEMVPEFYEKISARVLARGGFELVEFASRRALKPFVRPMLELMNETFRDLSGFSPLDTGEMDDLGRRFLPVVDPRFVKVVTADGQVVGFVIATPNISEGLRSANGRLLPLGWLRILRARRRTERLDLLLGGIKEGYRSRGADVLLGRAMVLTARRAGFTYMDSHHELECNSRMRAEMERMGGEVYKRYRVFQKPL